MKKCDKCNSEITSWEGETPTLKIPCIYSMCLNCGAVYYPQLKASIKLVPADKTNHGILSFEK